MKSIQAADTLSESDPLVSLEVELHAGLERFWRVAGTILHGSPVHLVAPDQETFSFKRNFFSILFLYSYYRAGITRERRILYVAINQCLRGMVTGCDNILDDEYKKTIETDLPQQAARFRSVLDIMLSDRILGEIVIEHCLSNGLPLGKMSAACRASLHTLLLSGVQEAAEEGGVTHRLPPRDILEKIHHFKTGVLFQSTWAVPTVLEEELSPAGQAVQSALYRIGIGCQLLDDLVDLFGDLRDSHHNYLLSVIFHQEPPEVWQRLCTIAEENEPTHHFYLEYPQLQQRIRLLAEEYLERGLRQLFFAQHAFLVHPAIAFIEQRIGALPTGG